MKVCSRGSCLKSLTTPGLGEGVLGRCSARRVASGVVACNLLQLIACGHDCVKVTAEWPVLL